MPVIEDCKLVNDWLREPDHAEKFSAKDWTRWTNSRPVDAMARLAAALLDQVVVPREPTPEMLDAAYEADAYWLHDTSEIRTEWRDEMSNVYRAMIAAFTPPQPSEDNGPDTGMGEHKSAIL